MDSHEVKHLGHDPNFRLGRRAFRNLPSNARWPISMPLLVHSTLLLESQHSFFIFGAGWRPRTIRLFILNRTFRRSGFDIDHHVARSRKNTFSCGLHASYVLHFGSSVKVRCSLTLPLLRCLQNRTPYMRFFTYFPRHHCH